MEAMRSTHHDHRPGTAGGRFTIPRPKWHRVNAMTALRELRRTAALSQQEFAALIDVPVNTFRMWDRGLRPLPAHVLLRSQAAVTAHVRNAERLSLGRLAREFGVHERTLRAAARTGRLDVTFS